MPGHPALPRLPASPAGAAASSGLTWPPPAFSLSLRPRARMFLAAFTHGRGRRRTDRHVHSRTFSGFGPSLTPQAEQTCDVGSHRPMRWKSRPTAPPCTQASHERRPSGVMHRLRQPRPRQPLHRQVLHVHRLAIADDLGESLWWKSRRASDTRACARATLTRAFSLLPLPFCLRDRSRCARRSFFSARRRNLGAAILVPSSSTAKSTPGRGRSRIRGHSRAAARGRLDHERREVPARRVADHRDRGRGGGQAPGPADLDVADLRQPQPPVAQHPEPGVRGEPHRLPAVFPGPETRRRDLRALPLPRDRREEFR